MSNNSTPDLIQVPAENIQPGQALWVHGPGIDTPWAGPMIHSVRVERDGFTGKDMVHIRTVNGGVTVRAIGAITTVVVL